MSNAQASGSSFGALKEEFLLNRYIAALQAENIKNRGLQILFNRMERERVSLDRSTRFDNVSADLTIGQKKSERPTFGKTNPFEPMEGSIKAISTGAATVRSRKRYGLEHVQTKHRRRYAGS
jgi:hypothetical protein